LKSFVIGGNIVPESVLEWGIALILTLQGLGDWLVGPMNIFTFTGNPEFYLLILPVIYWCWDSRLGLRVAIIFLLGLAVNLIMKVAIHDPRPYWIDPRVHLLTRAESSFGIPSGHSQNAVAIWGMLVLYLAKGWAWTAGVLLIFFIGLSRMYLGVHFPTDVFAGWGLGIIVLLLILFLERPVMSYLNKLGETVQVAIIFAVSLAIILIGGFIINSVSGSWQIPVEWGQNAAAQAPDHPIDPLSIDDIIVSASTLFGFLAGAILLYNRLGFNADGRWSRRVGRFLVGAVGVFILWQGLGALFDLVAADETLLSHILRYIHYSLIGVWISAVGPLVFIRLGLAENSKPLKQVDYA
jgi:membrane-associated phospholipid phosphatase